MWSHEASIDTRTTPGRIWRLFADVPGWKRWNEGIERIELHGPFADGTRFTMQPPGMDAFDSTLVEVRENQGFIDETLFEGHRVRVFHLLQALPDGGTRILYRTEIEGPEAAEIGPLVCADFPAVLAALKRLAEAQD